MIRPTPIAIALLVAAAPVPPARSPALPMRTGVVAPLAAPAVVPGIARCTSDGACTVTEEAGTRPGTPLSLAP